MFLDDAATRPGPDPFNLINQVRNQDRGRNTAVVANVPPGITEYQSVAG